MPSDQPSEPASEPTASSIPEEKMTEWRDPAEEIGKATFPVSVRGYDRAAVDAYANRVEQVVAELELRRSPEAAVKRALEQVGEQTRALLEQAGLTAEEITTAARHDAEGTIARANEEAEEIVAKAKTAAEDILARSQGEAEATVAQARAEAAKERERCQAEVTASRAEAEARVHELRADADMIQEERGRLLADIREITTRVEEVASAADVRFPSAVAPEQATDANLQSEVVDGAAEGEGA
ncbi:MAG TPA: DivIVA domain-containing protein [Gaiellaceae bacterium]|nr:DivIVA domain-containing protein [Gaiellaceae bacterium]